MIFLKLGRKQASSTAVIGLLALAGLIVVGSSIVGQTSEDFRGHVAFGLLTACALTVIAVVLSLRSPSAIFCIARSAWVLSAALALAISLAFGGEAGDTVLTFAMAALSFPSSLLVAPLIGTILGSATTEVAGLATLWSGLFIVGYAQWFLLLARLFQRRSPDPLDAKTSKSSRNSQ